MRKFTLGTALVDPAANEIRRDGDIVRLEPKAVEVLYLLASRAGQTVSKEEILETVWPNTVVTEDSIIRCVSQLRKAFGNPELIEAITRRGYRLNSPVSFIEGNDSSAAEKVPARTPGVWRHLRWAVPLLFATMATLAVCGTPSFPYWGVNAAIIIAAALIGLLVAPAIVKRMTATWP